MMKHWKAMGLAVLMAGMIAVAGCGGGGGGGGVAERTVSVTGVGNDTAADANVTYNVAAGDYTYTIAGFAAGDKIVLPAGTDYSVDNPVYTDGQVEFVTASTSGVVRIKLTGLTVAPATNAQDPQLNFPEDPNTMFGAGTVTQLH